MEIGNLIVRPFQLFFVAVVLGLSIALYRGQEQYEVPSITTFAVACGVIGAATFFVGIAAVFVQKLQGLVMLVLDGISTLFFLAASIALAVKLGVHDCENRPKDWNQRAYDYTKDDKNIEPPNPYCATNAIIAGGATVFEGQGQDRHFTYSHPNDWFVSRCRMAQALDAFLFFAFFAFAASLALDLLSSRKMRSSSD